MLSVKTHAPCFTPTVTRLIAQIALITPLTSNLLSPEEIQNPSVKNKNPPPRNETILRNFDLLLPNFHFILPNFYFGPPWENFISSLTIPDFLGRKETNSKMCGRTRRVTPCRDARSVRPSPNHLTCNSLSLIQRTP